MVKSHKEQLQKIKTAYPKAYEPWSEDDDELLKKSYYEGTIINSIAKTLQRQPSAVSSRLQKLGIINPVIEHKDRLELFFPLYRSYINTSEYQVDQENRQERHSLFGNLLSPSAIDSMTELEFGQVISSLWASQMWGNKGYLVEKLLLENGLEPLKQQLKELLWGDKSLAIRYEVFRKNIKGFGTAMLAEILAFMFPDRCGVWNDRARTALRQLGHETSLPFLHKSQLTGKEYQQFNDLLGSLINQIKAQSYPNVDYLGINYFFYEIWKATKEEVPEKILEPDKPEKDGDSFNHAEIIEQLIAIGQALGFQTEKEKLIAKGAKVDAVWRARIANLGVVMYVFEVQSHGSIDSLILNLQKSQVNQSVQRLVVVASAKDIEKIRGEISTLPESFRRAVSYWETSDVVHAAQLVRDLFGIINNLELVKSEFGI